VIVLPLGVYAAASMGGGIDVPKTGRQPYIDPGEELVRCYYATAESDVANPVCRVIVDPRTGVRSSEAAPVLNGRIEDFLTPAASRSLATWRRERDRPKMNKVLAPQRRLSSDRLAFSSPESPGTP
jgi:hypothetical protein